MLHVKAALSVLMVVEAGKNWTEPIDFCDLCAAVKESVPHIGTLRSAEKRACFDAHDTEFRSATALLHLCPEVKQARRCGEQERAACFDVLGFA